jgi:hypothetical protein
MGMPSFWLHSPRRDRRGKVAEPLMEKDAKTDKTDFEAELNDAFKYNGGCTS